MRTYDCDNCGKRIPTNRHGEIDDYLVITARGGYNAFTDDIGFWAEAGVTAIPMGAEDVLAIDRLLARLFCHDCCVALFDAFPAFTRLFGEKGHHPYTGDVPCCRYGWQFIYNEDGKPVGTRFGDGTEEIDEP